MALITENLKRCGVKIEVKIKGVPNSGSGVIYPKIRKQSQWQSQLQ